MGVKIAVYCGGGGFCNRNHLAALYLWNNTGGHRIVQKRGIYRAAPFVLAVFIFSFVVGMLCYLVPQKFIVRKDVQLYEDGGANIANRGKKLFIVKQYIISCLKSLKHIGIYLLVGILLGGIIEVYVPNHLISAAFRAGRVQSILAGALLGIPLSACGGSAIPIVSGMVDNGMGKGTALAFFIVGPATRPAPLVAMGTLFTPLFLIAYCLFLILSAVLMGLVYV